ncbi:hypothetical protein OB905_12525 [Halobacteria archaeon AArc-dxtr1]|nr:hypothetical protein [Halobacteria archaeon AArc-dxtr1]
MSDETTYPDTGGSWTSGSGLRDDSIALDDEQPKGCPQATFGPDDDPIVTIVDLVATVTDQDVTSMPPLFEQVDPEALGTLVDSSRPQGPPVTITFSYQRCRITVSSAGDVVVDPSPQ